MNKKLLIFIVTYNSSFRLKLILKKIQRIKKINYKILISDDCSNDDTSNYIPIQNNNFYININKRNLYDTINDLLTDGNINFLINRNDYKTNKQIIEQALECCKSLGYDKHPIQAFIYY